MSGSTKGFISGDLWTLILGAPAWSPSFTRGNTYTLFLCRHTLMERWYSSSERKIPIQGWDSVTFHRSPGLVTSSLSWEQHLGSTQGTSRLLVSDPPQHDWLPCVGHRGNKLWPTILGSLTWPTPRTQGPVEKG